MPEMDGIECMHRIRNQNGGLSRESKIVALTANAGSDTELLYAREGFDGYLLKPVSGSDLENELYRLLPKELVIVTGTMESLAAESMAWIRDHRKKANIMITTESVADLPVSVMEKYNIAVISHMVKTEKGLFRDGIEIETRGILSYMEDEKVNVETAPPTVAEHEVFFSDQLEKAHNIIHISISSDVEHSGYDAAEEAAGNFDNVFVVNSGHLSSGQGLMAIEAARLASEGYTTDEIIGRMGQMKKHVRTSFIVDSIDYLARANQVSSRLARLSGAFMVHPVIALRSGKMTISRILFGSKEGAYEKYVTGVFSVPGKINTRRLFVTYVGLTEKELENIGRLISKHITFDEIIYQKASPAIAVNCGPGTFGLLYFTDY